jgi:hypothetical protein
MSDLTLGDLNWMAKRDGPDWLDDAGWQELISAARAHLEGQAEIKALKTAFRVATGQDWKARDPQPPQQREDDMAKPDVRLVESAHNLIATEKDLALVNELVAALEAKDETIRRLKTELGHD